MTDAELVEGLKTLDDMREALKAGAGKDLKLEVVKWGTSGDMAYTLSRFTGGITATSGHVLAVHAALNAQARHGADIMSRIEFAMHGDRIPAGSDAMLRERVLGVLRLTAVGETRVLPEDLATTYEKLKKYFGS